jgi:DNA-binding MarR family transcriptional regulator
VSTEPKWLSERERATWVQLSAVLTLLPATLDSQLRRDADLTLFEYYVLAMLSEAPERTLRMSALAGQTNATLSRLSHVVTRLGDRGLVDRFTCPEDGRATNARLTALGWARLQEAAPKHVATVREHVIDALTPRQVGQLSAITTALLSSLDPDGAMTPTADALPSSATAD